MKFTDAQLESAIIELLEADGYLHVLGEAIVGQPQEVSKHLGSVQPTKGLFVI